MVRPTHRAFIWTTLLLVWLISLLPWRLWPQSPDILLLVIAFWCVHEPLRVGMVTAFVFGLLMDVHDATILGEHALSYTLVAYVAIVLRRRLIHLDLWSQAIHMLPLFFITRLLTTVIHAWIAGKWPGWGWAIGMVLTAALWPLVGWALHLPTRGADDIESASV
jgi:rod shape-determining protein MreD